MADACPARPSRGRWYILLLISVMYLITYLDRVNISTAAPLISKEFGFDKITMGVIFSAFVWAYALFQVPGGWLSDRFGARRRAGRRRHLLVDHDRRHRRGLQRHLVHRRSLPVRRRRSRRFSRRNARDAALVSAAANAASSRASPTAPAGSAPRSRRRSWLLIMTNLGWRCGVLHLRRDRTVSGRSGGA